MNTTNSNPDKDKSLDNFDNSKEHKGDSLKKGSLDNLQGGQGHEYTYSKTAGGPTQE